MTTRTTCTLGQLPLALSLLILSLLLLSLGACAGSGGLDSGLSPAADSRGQTAQAEMPSPSELRSVSGTFQKHIDGSNFLIRSLGAQADPDLGLMLIDNSAGAAGHLEWTIYGLYNGIATVKGVDVKLPPAGGDGPYYVGYTDFLHNVWDWHGPYSDDADLPAPGFGYANADGMFYIAIVAPGGSNVSIDELNLQLDGNGVLAVLTADPPEGEAPLGVGFDASASQGFDAALTKFEWDWEDDGTYDLDTGAVAHAAHGWGEPGWYNVRMKVTDANGQSDEDVVTVKVLLLGTVPPTAALEIQPSYIETGETILLDGSNSSDIDGNIILCSWDFDGDGVSDLETGGTKFTNHVYEQGGHYTVSLTVVDDGGMSDTISQEIDVHGWAKVVVDGGGNADVGAGLSLADIWGGPAIAYYDATNGALKYAVSSTTDGLDPADWTRITVDSAGNKDVGKMPSLCQVNGAPAVSYFDATAGALRYAYSELTLGTNPNFWHAKVLDDSGFDGQFSSLKIISGKPAISYYGGNDGLRYCRCKDNTGSTAAQWDFVTIDDGAGTGFYGCLAEISGHPAISYLGKPFDDLMFARSSDTAGLSPDKWSITTVDEDSDNGHYTNLADIGGTPGIVYYNAGSNQLRYARSNSVAGTSWMTKLLLDDGEGTGAGAGCSMALVGGKPAAVYMKAGGFNLRYMHSTTTTGESAAFWQQEDVVSDGSASSYTSIGEINGQPALAYYDNDTHSLVYSVRY